MRNDRKVPKHLFRPAFSSVVVLIITGIFSIIDSIESTNRAFLKGLHTHPNDIEYNHSCMCGFFPPQNRTDKLSVLPHKQSQGLRCVEPTCPYGASTSP
jgi:hypothetical protein